MSDTRALIVAIIGADLAVIPVPSMQIAGVNTPIDDVNTRTEPGHRAPRNPGGRN